MRAGFLFSCLVVACCSALPHTKEYHKLAGAIGSEYVPSDVAREPSCEELKAMWRFSKRQSRATEVTNEIPTYRDPFAYNIWIPYARSRSIVGGLGQRRKGIVYGKPIYEVPPPRSRTREEMARLFNAGVPHSSGLPARKVQPAFRLPGGVPLGQITHLTPSGSFQHLQKLIRAERARELQQQRMAEEEAARRAMRDGSPAYFGRIQEHQPAEIVYSNEGARKYTDDDYLSASQVYKHRTLPDPGARTADMDRGFFHH